MNKAPVVRDEHTSHSLCCFTLIPLLKFNKFHTSNTVAYKQRFLKNDSSQLTSVESKVLKYYFSFHPINKRNALPEDICSRILLTFLYGHHRQFYKCWIFTVTQDKNSALQHEDWLVLQCLSCCEREQILTSVNEK